MQVINRHGIKESVHFDTITERISKLCVGLNVDPVLVTQKTISGFYNGISTSEIDTLAAETAAYLSTTHNDYSMLASRIAVSNLHKNTDDKFSTVIKKMYEHVTNGQASPLVSDEFYNAVLLNQELLDSSIVTENDFLFDYFGFKTLEKSYLLKLNGKIVERPQYMIMRVAVGIHMTDIDAVIESYNLMSNKWFTHATPTLYNAGSVRPQMSSCFLLQIKGDSIDSIFATLKDCANISKYAGGIGVSIHDIRASKSYIRGTGGISNGIVPMLRCFDATARYVDQCFAPETHVYTNNGPFKIKDVSVGDMVLSATGKYNKVDKVLKYDYTGKILKIKTKTASVRVTGEHQVFFMKSEATKESIEIGYSAEELCDAKELQVGMYVYFPQYELNGDITTNKNTYMKIQSIEEEDYTGDVYDFEVADEHTYVTNLGAVHNGGGKRKGSFAIYLEPHHLDIFEFLDMKKNTGSNEEGARDLFYALWVSDLFMKRVESDSNWSLFCPNEAPNLAAVYGDEFETLYTRYESEGKARRVVKARDLWTAIIQTQIETGTPYMLYKDSINRKNNQSNLGTLRSSNLCTEIMQYTSPEEIAVCNLASINLSKFVRDDKTFNFDKLVEISKIVTKNLNKVIDKNFYPVKEAETSNMLHRPIGIGVQGLADTFILMRYPYESVEAQTLNRDIFEAIYYGALTASMELAQIYGTYKSYNGSPTSKGLLQFDMWGVKPSKRFDWDSLKLRIVQNGLRNSLLLAPMPTASTAQILGNNESFEPFTSNIYARRVLSGDFMVVNKHLIKDLVEIGKWTPEIRNQIIADGGSVQQVYEIPQELKNLYKTAWEISTKVSINMSVDRGAFICQSQSFNLFVAEPTLSKLTSIHFYGWKQGLKTGMYYLRTRPKASAIAFTVDQKSAEMMRAKNTVKLFTDDTCAEGCVSCGS